MNLRLIFLVFFLCSPISSYADIVFINNNKAYSLEISYQFCEWGLNTSKCGEINTAKIDNGEKNNLVIPVPEMLDDSQTQVINLISSTAKDPNGNVIAKGSYDGGPILGNNNTYSGEKYRYGWVINFDVIQELGIISNHASEYSYSGPSSTAHLSALAKFGNEKKTQGLWGQIPDSH